MKYLHIVAGLAVLLAASSTFAAARVPVSNSSAATIFPFSIKTPMPSSTATAPARIATLDIMGIGLSVEMFRQSQAWMQMQQHPKGSILPSDLSKYPTSYTFKDLASDKRAADVLEYGCQSFRRVLADS